MARSTKWYIKMILEFVSDVFASDLALKMMGGFCMGWAWFRCQSRNKQHNALFCVPKQMRHSTDLALKYSYLCNSLGKSFSVKMKASLIQKILDKRQDTGLHNKAWGCFYDSPCTDSCTHVACVTSDCSPVIYKNLGWQPFPSVILLWSFPVYMFPVYVFIQMASKHPPLYLNHWMHSSEILLYTSWSDTWIICWNKT